MRGDDEIRQPQIEQNIALLWGLDGQNVETRAANDFVGQRIGQGFLVDEPAAAGVDQNAVFLHQPQFTRADHVFGLGRQRQMQGNNVALAQQGFETGQARLREDVIGQHPLAKSLGDPAHCLADRAIADDAERRSGHVADGMVEETELVAVLPAPGAHIVAVSHEITAKRESQREDMFRHCVEGIIADIRYDNAVCLAVGFVHDIRAGGGDRDHF